MRVEHAQAAQRRMTQMESIQASGGARGAPSAHTFAQTSNHPGVAATTPIVANPWVAATPPRAAIASSAVSTSLNDVCNPVTEGRKKRAREEDAGESNDEREDCG